MAQPAGRNRHWTIVPLPRVSAKPLHAVPPARRRQSRGEPIAISDTPACRESACPATTTSRQLSSIASLQKARCARRFIGHSSLRHSRVITARPDSPCKRTAFVGESSQQIVRKVFKRAEPFGRVDRKITGAGLAPRLADRADRSTDGPGLPEDLAVRFGRGGVFGFHNRVVGRICRNFWGHHKISYVRH